MLRISPPVKQLQLQKLLRLPSGIKPIPAQDNKTDLILLSHFQEQCSLSEIIKQQAGKNYTEPCNLYWHSSEMSHVCIQSFASCYNKKYRAENYKTFESVFRKKIKCIVWIYCRQNLRSFNYGDNSKQSNT